MPENEFLELCRDSDRIDSEYAFKGATIHVLGTLGNGAIATAAAFSSPPLAPVGMALSAVLAGVSVWKGIQEIGKGVQSFESPLYVRAARHLRERSRISGQGCASHCGMHGPLNRMGIVSKSCC